MNTIELQGILGGALQEKFNKSFERIIDNLQDVNTSSRDKRKITILEVEQPASDFVFRMKADKYDGILCAIFEADGGAWKVEATQRIKDYLMRELEEYPQFTVIS